VILYLAPIPEGGIVAGPVADEGAGVPADQPLYDIVTPQGFVLETDQGAVQPEEGRTYEGASLDEFEPSDRAFPEQGSNDQSN